MPDNKRGFLQLLFSEVIEIPKQLQNSYIFSLNGFRTISIAFVIFGHTYSQIPGVSPGKIVEVASLGVYIFFVISGFLITTLLLKEKIKTGDISLTNFYKKRVLRIIPLAYLYPVVLFVLNYIFKLHISFLAFVGPFIFLSNLSVLNRSQYLGHYWSLSVEEQFYLFFPVVLKRNFKLYMVFLITLLVALIFLRQFDFISMKNTSPKLYRLQYLKELINSLDGIIIGSFLSIFTFKGIISLEFFKKNKALINIILLPLIILIHCEYINIGLVSIRSVIVSVMIAAVIITNIQESNGLFFKFLNNRLVSYIGMMSYSIYIWQQLFTFTVKPVLSGYFPYADSVLFNLSLLGIIAYLSYNYYEKQFLKLKKHIA